MVQRMRENKRIKMEMRRIVNELLKTYTWAINHVFVGNQGHLTISLRYGLISRAKNPLDATIFLHWQSIFIAYILDSLNDLYVENWHIQ